MNLEMSLSYYCYLIVEKNKLNTMRLRQYQRINRHNNEITKKKGYYSRPCLLDSDRYIKDQLILLEKIQIKIKDCKKIMSEARRATGYSPYYNSSNFIKNIHKDGTCISEDQIKRLHDDYLAEAAIFGIDVKNPYEMGV